MIDNIRKLRNSLFDAIDEIERSLEITEYEIDRVDEKLKKEIGHQCELGERIREKYEQHYRDIKNRILLMCKETENYDDSVLFRLQEVLEAFNSFNINNKSYV